MLALDTALWASCVALPPDWKTRVDVFDDRGVTAPLTEALKKVVHRHGDAAITIEQVQALAVRSCGLRNATEIDRYNAIFSRLVAAARGTWPITAPLDEANVAGRGTLLGVSNAMAGCDGEWLALNWLVGRGWIAFERGNRDWHVRRDDVTRTIEVKTKRALGSTRGWLELAIQGLAMLPGASWMRQYHWHWMLTDALPEGPGNAFLRLLVASLEEIHEVARQADGHPHKFGADDQSMTVFAYPQAGIHIYFAGMKLQGDPAKTNGEKMMIDIPASTFHGAAIEKDPLFKAWTRVLGQFDDPDRSLLFLVWQMPWGWRCEAEAVKPLWREWCSNRKDKVEIKEGVLLPICHEMELEPVATTDAEKLI